MRKSIAVLFCFLLVSCGGLGTKNNKLVDKSAAIEARQLESARLYVKATGDAFLYVPATIHDPALDLAKEFNDKAESIIGRPTTKKPINVSVLLGENKRLREVEHKYLNQLEKEDSKNATELAKVQLQLKQTQDKLIQLGKEKEAENNRNIVKKVWRWAVGSFGIAGAVAFFVFCPGVALPLASILFKLIMGMIPHIFNFLGSFITTIFETVKKIWIKK